MKLYRPKYTRKGVTHTSEVWWYDFTVEGTRCRKSTGLRNRKAAEIKAREAHMRAELRAAGVPIFEATEIPLQDLLEEYFSELRRRGRSDKHVKTMIQRCRVMLDTDKIQKITPQYLRKKMAAPRLAKLAPVTRNEYLNAVSFFFTWLIKEGRWQGNPAQKLTREREESPAEKGVLSLDEIRDLIQIAPLYRQAVYWVTATTGLRRKELGLLERTDLDLTRGVLRLSALRSKGRRKTELVLHPEVVFVLKRHLASVEGGKVFPIIPRNTTFKKDLQRAGLDLHDSAGNPRTLHSLRVSLATILADSNVPLTLAQKILRHSTPALTANVYTKHSLDAQREALCRMLSPDNSGEQSFTETYTNKNDGQPDSSPATVEARDESRTHGLRITNAPWDPHTPHHVGPQEALVECLDSCLALIRTCPATGLSPFWDAQAARVLQEGRNALYRSLLH